MTPELKEAPPLLCPFPTLPPEMVLLLVGYLDYPSLFSLLKACAHVRTLMANPYCLLKTLRKFTLFKKARSTYYCAQFDGYPLRKGEEEICSLKR